MAFLVHPSCPAKPLNSNLSLRLSLNSLLHCNIKNYGTRALRSPWNDTKQLQGRFSHMVGLHKGKRQGVQDVVHSWLFYCLARGQLSLLSDLFSPHLEKIQIISHLFGRLFGWVQLTKLLLGIWFLCIRHWDSAGRKSEWPLPSGDFSGGSVI